MAKRSGYSGRRAARVEGILMEGLKRMVNSPFSVGRIKGLKATYRKRVVEMSILKEVVHRLSKRGFDEVTLSEGYSRARGRSWRIHYSLVFRSGEEKIGYAALIYIPELQRDHERSGGVVLAIRYSEKDGEKSEGAKFDDYLMEVKPHIEVIGDLYRRARRL